MRFSGSHEKFHELKSMHADLRSLCNKPNKWLLLQRYFSSAILENIFFHESSAAPSGPRSHPANTTTGRAFAPLRCAGSQFAASAKQRRLRPAFIARPPPHPPLMRGTDALKTSGDRNAAQAPAETTIDP
jgi:hypothetical protein